MRETAEDSVNSASTLSFNSLHCNNIQDQNNGKQTPCFKTAHLNVRSLRHKLDEV